MINQYKPAIVVVGYNRPKSMERLLNSIGSAKYNIQNIELIISIDKSDKSDEVEEVAKEFNWLYGEKIIRVFKKRQGLRNHILQCGDLSNKYGAVIILEDDLFVSPMFYVYTLESLNYYKENDKIAGISLYSHRWNGYATNFFDPLKQDFDVYFAQFSITWGQCWTNIHWNNFKKWYDKNKLSLDYNKDIPMQITNWPDTSWGKFFVHYLIEENKYYVIPYLSLTTNFSEIGQHVKSLDSSHQVPIMNSKDNFKFAPFNSSIKYDIFFENENLIEILKDKYNLNNVCIDLYGSKNNINNYNYLLSTQCLDYKIESSFGLQMRPHEVNVIQNIPGNDIYLYNINIYDKFRYRERNSKMKRYKYEVRSLNWRQLIPYGIYSFFKTVKRHLKIF